MDITDLNDYSLFTFFRIDEDGCMSTHTILAKHLNEAIFICKQSFQPDSYHEVKMTMVNELLGHNQFYKHPRPLILADNNDIKPLI